MMFSRVLFCILLTLAITPKLCSTDPSVKSALQILGLVNEHMKKEDNLRNIPMSDVAVPTSMSSLPQATISYAQTFDGSIAPLDRSRLDISSKCSFRLLHSLRARHDAVLVGINTVICDRPRLNVRDPLPFSSTNNIAAESASAKDSQAPRPVVIDSDLRILDISLDELKLERPIVCTCVRPGEPHGKWEAAVAKLEHIGGELASCSRNKDGKCDIVDSFRVLKKDFGIQSVLVEGGATIIQSVLKHRLAQQVVVTLRPCFFGGYRSMTDQLPAPVALRSITVASIEGDIVVHGLLDSYGEEERKKEGGGEMANDTEGNNAHTLGAGDRKESEQTESSITSDFEKPRRDRVSLLSY